MKENLKVNSWRALDAAKALLDALYLEHKALDITVSAGAGRSLSQNALLHAWCHSFSAYALKIEADQVSKEDVDGMKRELKKRCYIDTGWDYLVINSRNPLTGERSLQLRSSADYGVGEMYRFLEWVQGYAAGLGCILESAGDYLANKHRGLA